MKGESVFYSIIVPARDEGKYITRTLKRLNSLDYPRDRYEIIVVESGSSDNTLAVAKRFASKLIKVYHVDRKGVSVARNYGASKASRKAEWLIFSDADNILRRDFLEQISKTIRGNKSYVAGTMRMIPLEKSFRMSAVYYIYNIFLRAIRGSYALQMIKKEFFVKVRYDEKLKVGEDYIILEALRKYGCFFFIWGSQVETSTRRFRKWGALKLLGMWARGSLGRYDYKKKLEYEVVR